MKRMVAIWLGCVLIVCYALSSMNNSEPLKLKGFYLGMDMTEVRSVYQKMVSENVATYISIENSEFRDLINVDNEFSSMGNKIEINYDESGKVNSIRFQYKTVDILFDASALSPEEFVKKFSEDYEIPEMKFEDMGMVKTWSYSDEARKFSLSIDDYKNITLKTL